MSELPSRRSSFEDRAIPSRSSENSTLAQPHIIMIDAVNATAASPTDVHAVGSAGTPCDSPMLVDNESLSYLRDAAVLRRTRATEVEVRMSEDLRNKFLPGLRIVVRFRLLL
jgi:hypothetical protein